MEFLLELLTEELPASHIRAAVDQIEAGLRKELADGRIEARSLRVLATPRRLVVHRWPAAADFRRWYASAEYRPWRDLRWSAASTRVALVEGLSAAARKERRLP